MLQNKKYIDNLQETIQNKLEENQISIKELERKAGLKVSAVQNILSGRSSNPGIEALISLSKALDCSLDELVGETRAQNFSNKSGNKVATETHQANIPWNYKLYQECAEAVDNYLKSKNLKTAAIPNTELVLFLIKEAYIYSAEGNNNKADLKFIKWIIDSHCR